MTEWVCGFYRDGACLNDTDGGDGTCDRQPGDDMWECPIEVRRRDRISERLEGLLAQAREREASDDHG